MKAYMGVDVGSVSTKFAVLDGNSELLATEYLPTEGKPIESVQLGLKQIRQRLSEDVEICGLATTGSARRLAGVIVGADLVKNEITTHAVGALFYVPEAQTIIEIGGQDSKIIVIRNGVVTDFGMNTVCAAGTGSFLDHQAQRLHMSIGEFSQRALESTTPVRVAGRCTVFAESDMVHKQQMGHNVADIIYGLCQALVRNYLNNVACGKEIRFPVAFQGGVGFNQGIVRALREELGDQVIVPPHHEVLGAIGAALIMCQEARRRNGRTSFKGFQVSETEYRTSSFECEGCPNRCEIASVAIDGQTLAQWGGRCERGDWAGSPPEAANTRASSCHTGQL